MNNDEILQAAKEIDLSKYLRSYSEFDEIAEQAGCDMSAMDGREYETMWCDRAQFEKLCIGISAIIEKRMIERCAVVSWNHYMETCRNHGHGPDVESIRDFCSAAVIRKLGEH